MAVTRKVALVGLGNLGSRHLQGLARCTAPLSIRLFDPSPEAIARAHERWAEAGGPDTAHAIIDKDLATYDVAIIATTAAHRTDAIASLKQKADVAAWVLEKPLAQSLDQLQKLDDLISGPAWVNTPRRVIPWHREIAEHVRQIDRPLDVTVEGGPWGLACNAIHFVDMVRWWTGTPPTAVDVSGLSSRWHASKREGYSEIFGTLAIAYEDGSRLSLVSTADGGPHAIVVKTPVGQYTVEEGAGRLTLPDGAVREGRMAYQSELTGTAVDLILQGSDPGLPPLAAFIETERALLASLIPHRMADGGPADRLDVT